MFKLWITKNQTKNQVETCSSQRDNKNTWYDWKETLLTFIQDDIVDNIDNTNIGNIDHSGRCSRKEEKINIKINLEIIKS